jgi:hypothetical protein
MRRLIFTGTLLLLGAGVFAQPATKRELKLPDSLYFYVRAKTADSLDLLTDKDGWIYFTGAAESPDSLDFHLADEDGWVYFTLINTIEATIIDHCPAPPNGEVERASLTIALTSNGDTIRILSLYDIEPYAPGKLIKVAPAEAPSSYVTGCYSHQAFKTTWGRILNPPIRLMWPSYYYKGTMSSGL